MGTAANGVNLCYVAYGFSGVSVLATGALSLLQCCTCNACGLGFLLDTVFAAAGAGWWALAGVVLRYHTQQPAVLALPHAETRRWIVMLCWVRRCVQSCVCLGKGGDANSSIFCKGARVSLSNRHHSLPLPRIHSTGRLRRVCGRVCA
jgi:hypothetical protein